MKIPRGSATADHIGRSGSIVPSAVWQLLLILGLLMGAFSPGSLSAEDPNQTPQLISLFPLGAGRDSLFQPQIRGKNLQGVYGVWFYHPGLRGHVKRIEQISIEEKKTLREDVTIVPGQRVTLEIRIDPEVEAGKYQFRLVSPWGTSNALQFLVVEDSVILELPGERNTPKQAQVLPSFAVVNGRIGRQGEVDFYAVDLQVGQQLVLHALSNTTSRQFDAIHLTLHRAQGSWFDPDRPLRLAFSPDAQLSYQCDKSGRYLIEVGTALGVGSPDLSYQLHVAVPRAPSASSKPETVLPPTPLARLQLPLQRHLKTDRLQEFQLRTVSLDDTLSPRTKSKESGVATESSASTMPEKTEVECLTLSENDWDEAAESAPVLSLPVILEGAIERPADRDVFRFRVEAQTSLAFELETPEATPPQFNPHLSVLDSQGEEILTNYFKKIAGDGDDWVKLIQAKTLYTFERAGEYDLKIRDITPRYGDPSFRYRIMVRPQVPHLGSFDVTPQVVHLTPGKAGKLTIVTHQEEGFQGEVAFRLEGLPVGVQALPGADVEPDKEPPLPEIHKERFVAKNQKTTILLVADGAAPVAKMPTKVRLKARPVVEGKVGQTLDAGEFLVMVRTPPASQLPSETEDPS